MSPVPKKIERGDSLVSPGMVCYAEKQVKPFWFSSLDQIVQFDTIIFCRTFKNYFGQFVWIEKKKKKKSHYNSRVSLHEAPTKNVLFMFFLVFIREKNTSTTFLNCETNGIKGKDGTCHGLRKFQDDIFDVSLPKVHMK